MTYKSDLGQFGEKLACEYLVKKHYKVIETNFRKPWGEIDIIVLSPDKTLVFVEVKTMRQLSKAIRQYGNKAIALLPEDQLTKAKLVKLQRTASLYANHRPELVRDNKGWRIDLVAIEIGDNEKYEIRHLENI